MKREIAICSFWLLFSFYLSFESYRLGLVTTNRPGPGLFPLIATVGIGLIAALRLINSIRITTPEESSESNMGAEGWMVLYVIAGMTAYAYLIESLGFVLCTFLLVAFYLKIIAARRWPVTLIFAAAVAMASHLFFDVLLRAELPRGLLHWLI